MHEFKHEELEACLAENVIGFSTLDGIEKFGKGQSNPTYKVTSGVRHFVLRAKPPGDLLKSAHAVDREFRVMSALSGSDVPVPQMFWLSDDNSPMGTQVFVMDFVEGHIHWNPNLKDLQPSPREKIYDQMNATLASLHDVDVNKVGLADYGKSGNYFQRQTDRWTKQYRASETDKIADADWMIDWLNDNMVEDDGAVSIVHGDYRLDNMIFDASGNLQALLDWELSTLGHPMADLSYQVAFWRLPNQGKFKGLGGIDRAALRLPSDEDYIAKYCERRGISKPKDWNFYMAFSMFRFMAIIQGVLKRGLDGSASNPLGLDFMKASVQYLAYDAKKIAQGC